jgi:capsular polysaccharide biosynthesis protein
MIEAAEQRAWAIRPEPQRESTISAGAGDLSVGPQTFPAAPPSKRQLVGRLLQAAWRRRFLLIVPVILMLPASFAVALLVPGIYTAHTLLLLQEGEKGNPLARETAVSGSMQQRVVGLEALLKSDQVLIPILNLPAGADPRRVSTALQDLRKDLTLELIGSDFISVDLRGSKSEGLGDKLSRILARFFEVLLAENAPSAANVVIQRRRDELQAAENERSRLQAEVARVLPAGLDSTNANVHEIEALMEQQRSANAEAGQLHETEQALGDLKSKLNESADLQRRLASAERELARQRADYETYLNRFGDLTSGQGASVLNAPGRIKVIDPPTDPVTKSSSRLKFLAAGFIGSILIVIGLAWAAETLDSAIRYPDQLASATGLPVLAHLPQIRNTPDTALATEAEQSMRHPSRLRWKLAAVVMLVAALAGFAASFVPSIALTDSYTALRGLITRAL